MTDSADTFAHTWLIDPQPSNQAIEALRSRLVADNIARASIDESQDLAVFIHDGQGQLVGGVIGTIWGQCLEVNYLWVHPTLRGRGYGKRLMQTVEQEARKQKCHTAVLDTYSFQAPGFYRKLGYEALAVIDGYPRGYQKLFLKKKL